MGKRMSIILMILIAITSKAQDREWQILSTPSTNGLTNVSFTDTLHGVLFQLYESQAGIRTTSDGGVTWSNGAQIAMRPSNISMISRDTGWAIGDNFTNGSFYTTSDNWKTFNLIYEKDFQLFSGGKGFSTSRATAIGPTHYSIVGKPDSTKQVLTTDGGATWTISLLFVEGVQSLRNVYFLDSLHGWVDYITNDWHSLRTVDGGATWENPVPFPFGGVTFFLDSLNGWVASGDSVFRSRDGGRIWQPIGSMNDQSDANGGITFLDSLNGWTFGGIFYQGFDAEAIHKTTDGGKTWQQESVGLCANLTSGMMFDKTHGWAVSEDGVVLAYLPKTQGVEKLPELPRGYMLRQNYPNPFNPATTIDYELPEQSFVNITVSDVTGRQIRTVVSQEQQAGVYRVKFEATGLASGTYYYTLKAGSFRSTKAMVIVK